MSTETWIVVADKAHTRIFSKKQLSKEWSKINLFVRDTGTDDPSRDKGTVRGPGPGTRALVNEEGMERRLYDHYYQEVAQHLNKARTQHLYGDILLVASGEVLGGLRDRLDKETHKQIKKTVTKDLAHFTQKDLEEYLREDFIFTGDLH